MLTPTEFLAKLTWVNVNGNKTTFYESTFVSLPYN
jgi:hypothetical protein